jgi:putative ABC transport system permease protein
MTYKHLIKTAITGLETNRSRSILTIIGIVIGITAIMLVMSLGAGAQNLILSQVQGLGTNTIAVVPGLVSTSPSSFAANLYSDSLKPADLTALESKANVPGLADIMPVVLGSEPATYQSNDYQVTLFGATDLIASIFDLTPTAGQFFTADDVTSQSKVAVIGSKVASNLFGNDNPINQQINVNGVSFQVVAVLPSSGGGSLFDFDDMTIMPYTTAQTYLLGIKYFNRLIIEAAPGANVEVVADDITTTLAESHNITDPTKYDFTVQTQQDLANRLGIITTALTWFLVAMASIALFVGGIGIMNIMLVAVTERTREIGLRKALGATDRDILAQFLIEAVFLTGIGGLIGIVLGSSLAYLISLGLSYGLGLNWQFVFPWFGAVLGFGVSALIGLVFGSYPAHQASKKSPIEALRYE